MRSSLQVRSFGQIGRDLQRDQLLVPTGSRGVDVDVALIVVAIAWGSSYLVAKDVVTTDTVLGFLAIRFGIAVVCLAVPLVPKLVRITSEEVRLGIVYGAILSAIFVLETTGVIGTTASNAGLIISLTMLITPWLEGRIRRTPIPRSFYAAGLVALLGVALLTQATGLNRPTWGDGLILLAAIARAVHVTVIDATSRGRHLDSARVTVVQLVVVLVVFGVGSLAIGSSPLRVAQAMDTHAWILVVYLAVACTVFAFFVQMWAVRRTSPARVSMLLGTEPLWAAVVGISLGGDPLTVFVVAGAILVLAGTAAGTRT